MKLKIKIALYTLLITLTCSLQIINISASNCPLPSGINYCDKNDSAPYLDYCPVKPITDKLCDCMTRVLDSPGTLSMPIPNVIKMSHLCEIIPDPDACMQLNVYSNATFLAEQFIIDLLNDLNVDKIIFDNPTNGTYTYYIGGPILLFDRHVPLSIEMEPGVVITPNYDIDVNDDNCTGYHNRNWDDHLVNVPSWQTQINLNCFPLFFFDNCKNFSFIGNGGKIIMDYEKLPGILRNDGTSVGSCPDDCEKHVAFFMGGSDHFYFEELDIYGAVDGITTGYSRLYNPYNFDDPVGQDTRVSEDITIKNCLFEHFYRNGMSFFSVKDLTIEGCEIRDLLCNQAGISFENDASHFNFINFENINIRNCIFADEIRWGIDIKPIAFAQKAQFNIENCLFKQSLFGISMHINSTDVNLDHNDPYLDPNTGCLADPNDLTNCDSYVNIKDCFFQFQSYSFPGYGLQTGIHILNNLEATIPVNIENCVFETLEPPVGGTKIGARPIQIAAPVRDIGYVYPTGTSTPEKESFFIGNNCDCDITNGHFWDGVTDEIPPYQTCDYGDPIVHCEDDFQNFTSSTCNGELVVKCPNAGVVEDFSDGLIGNVTMHNNTYIDGTVTSDKAYPFWYRLGGGWTGNTISTNCIEGNIDVITDKIGAISINGTPQTGTYFEYGSFPNTQQDLTVNFDPDVTVNTIPHITSNSQKPIVSLAVLDNIGYDDSSNTEELSFVVEVENIPPSLQNTTFSVRIDVAGSATNGWDYEYFPKFVTIKPFGQSSKYELYTIRIKPDEKEECSETIQLTLRDYDLGNTGAMDHIYNISNDNQITLTINEIKPCCSPILQQNLQEYDIDYYQADNIISTSNIHPDAYITYKAGTSVTLKPGFNAFSGSNLHAYIDGCSVGKSSNNGDTNQEIDEKVMEAEILMDIPIDNLLSFTASPNPFDRQTMINFELQQATTVSMSIFNNVGQEVKRLMDNETQAKGKHEVKFESEGLPTGIYFCIINTGEQQKTQKLMLLD